MLRLSQAISKVATLAGQSDVATDYSNRAAALKSRFQADIWNTTLTHFIDRHQSTTKCVKYYQPIRGRELVGLVPWMFNMPDDSTQYAASWRHLLNTSELAGPYGMRTNEPSYQYYMRQYRYEGSNPECQWNGPVWPYQTTQVLLGMANLLNNYKQQSIVSKADYMNFLRQYTKLHYRVNQNNVLNLQEDYYPDKAGEIVGLSRSHHYFHSGYVDLIMNGLVGIRPRADDVIEVNPLIPDGSSLSYFRVENVPYHGHLVAVQWDANGSRYGQGAGLRIEVDGKVVASSATLGRLTANINRVANPAITRKIAKSVQLTRGQYPSGTASSGTDSERIHDAIDGRIIFFPEAPNGWESDATSADSQQWYTINFGSSTTLSSCELAFFADNGTYAIPKDYTIQKLVGSDWVKIAGFGEQLIGTCKLHSILWRSSLTPALLAANGIVNVNWDPIQSSQLRGLFTQPASKKIRLVEFKVY